MLDLKKKDKNVKKNNKKAEIWIDSSMSSLYTVVFKMSENIVGKIFFLLIFYCSQKND